MGGDVIWRTALLGYEQPGSKACVFCMFVFVFVSRPSRSLLKDKANC